MIITKFLDSLHEERYNELLMQADCAEFDRYRASLFYIIASNNKLFEDVKKIYNFRGGYVKSNYKKSILSSSEKTMLILGLDLYGCSSSQSISDIFCGLDERNTKIAITVLIHRFCNKREDTNGNII